jgi:hypothetical protein
MQKILLGYYLNKTRSILILNNHRPKPVGLNYELKVRIRVA